VRVATKGVNTGNVVTFEVKIEVISPNRALLRPEMTATAKIIIDSRSDVLTIPVSAFSRGLPQDDKADNATRPASAEDRTANASGDANAQPTTRPRGRGRGRRNGGAAGASWPIAGGGPKVQPVVGTVTVLNDNGTQEQRKVTVGLSDDENYEVIDGLDEGEQVVLNKNGGDSRWRGGQGRRGNIMPRGFGRR
jgi:multidrug efflux pump subunit AcrA (membrane-fusion protein)